MKEAVRIIASLVVTLGLAAGVVLGPYYLGTLAWDHGLTVAATAWDLWWVGFVVGLLGITGIVAALFAGGIVIALFVGIARQIYIGLGGNPR